MTALEILKAARAKIEKPENWTQGIFARDERGRGTEPQAPDACQWCALGAVGAVTPLDERHWGGKEALDTLYSVVGIGVTTLNDTGTHAEVLAAFDRAIEALSA